MPLKSFTNCSLLARDPVDLASPTPRRYGPGPVAGARAIPAVAFVDQTAALALHMNDQVNRHLAWRQVSPATCPRCRCSGQAGGSLARALDEGQGENEQNKAREYAPEPASQRHATSSYAISCRGLANGGESGQEREGQYHFK
jgi:hypothetical protein